ncbi:MAG: dihydroorotase [Bacillota bacterium]|nr:dihydroorotase [Bacillota bacterium]
MKLLIKNGTLINPHGEKNGAYDVLIEGGRVTKIEKGIEINGAEIIEAAGKHVLPGFFDMHCHLREPGYEYQETIRTGAMAAARGGYAAIACMANTNPPADCAAVIGYIKSRAAEAGYAKVYPVGAVTAGLRGEALAEMGELKEAGAVAVSDDGRPMMDANLMKNVLVYAKNFDMLVISHCEDILLANEGHMNEGVVSTELGLKGISRAAEEVMVARDAILAGTYDARVHIAHVSTAGSVEIIRQAKKAGVKVSCETAPHYFSATDEAVRGFNTNAKVNPPLRTKEDAAAIIAGLCDGTIDCIATDHAPHHEDDKNVEFAYAASGISGLETAFSLSYMNLVKAGKMGLERMVSLLSYNPCKILGIKGGAITQGGEADITIVDLDAEYVLKKEDMVSLGKNTPFLGQKLAGKVIHTVIGGKWAVRDGKVI